VARRLYSAAAMFDSGYLTLFKLGRRGVAVRMHWTAPIAAWLLTGRDLSPVRWLTFLIVILCHELGHAFMVRRARARVLSIALTAIGGNCTWGGSVTRYQRAYIAWGGVLAQGILYAIGQLIWRLGVQPFGLHTFAVVDVLIDANLVIALVNLLPVKPLDGAEAWALIPMLPRRLRVAQLNRRLRSLERARQRLDRDDDDSGFVN
jgi:Zn-dependent protease